MDKHYFEPGNKTRLDSIGREMRLCAVCGKPGRGQGHLAREPQPAPRILQLKVKGASRGIRLLAIAVAIALEEKDEVGWRLRFRLADIARTIREVHPELIEESLAAEPSMKELSRLPQGEPRQIYLESEGIPVTTKGIRRAITKMTDVNLARIAKAAVEAGYTGRRSKNNHLILYHPNGEWTLSFALGDTDPRSWRNARAEARRQGLEV